MSHFRVTSNGSVRTIQFTEGRLLDEPTIRSVGDELLGLLDNCKEDKILLDFRAVRFMSSSALGALVRFYKHCKQSNVTLKLCRLPRDVLDIFRITNLNKVFEIHRDEDEAMAAFEE